MNNTYDSTWQSLISYGTPGWMADEKFGLYAHWGLYSIPGYGNEWYGKWMYDPANAVHELHKKNYGPPSKFGYKEFIPQFTAKNYDPSEWAELFARSGAGYAGFSLAHHDGFGLWESDVYKWNVGHMGPKRDLYGELAAEVKKRGLKLVAPFHIIRGFNWFLPGWNQYDQSFNQSVIKTAESEGWDLVDPEFGDFYWTEQSGADFEVFLQLWKDKVKEVIDKYEPDLMWFDGGRFRDDDLEIHALDVLSYYLNRSVDWGKEVGVMNKLPVNLIYNFHEDFGIRQFEEGRSRPAVLEGLWNDDMRIGDKSWGWVEGQKYKSGKEILHGLIDRVSRGGSLMLSLSPMADGTIPGGQREPLEQVGAWLSANGEAIRGTRTWSTHAEGDTAKLIDHSGRFDKWKFTNCTAEDIRYTASKDGSSVYAITLGKPEDKVLFSALGTANAGKVLSVELLGDSRPVSWEQHDSGLALTLTDTGQPEQPAYAWKVVI